MQNQNYYELLEVSSDTNPDEIYKSYQRARNAYTGDGLALYSLLSPEECQAILSRIDEAYTVLSDPEKRRQYDQARGIEDTYKPGPTVPTSDDQFETAADREEQETKRKSMTKIVAQKRFQLEYDIDTDFEKEIESASLFDGNFLKKVREYKKVDLPRMADLTKVSKTYLKYIEEEEFDKLPATVYVRGFVFQYAKCLKLNPDLVATSFLTRLKESRSST